MPVRIKICGINSADTLDAAIEARADFCGFVIFPPSPRHLESASLRSLGNRAAGRIKRVGLFVDASDVLIGEAMATGALDVMQFHGEETPERVAQAKARFGLPVWKAVAVSAQRDVEQAKRYEGSADLLLFDTKTPKDAALPGGMGLRFDWSLLTNFRSPVHWGLAGGLSPANVGEAIGITHAPLVDTSSGVEISPGVKDPELIRAFCAAVCNA